MSLPNETANPIIAPPILALDSQLHSLVGKIEILDAIKPLNYIEQKKDFFNHKFSHNPEFIYKKSALSPSKLKRELYNLPIEDLEDEDLYSIYQPVIDSYADKIDQLASIGTPQFLYNSLRYYGEPTDKDIRNAEFILHLPNIEEADTPSLDSLQIKEMLDLMCLKENYSCSIKYDSNMIANALVSGTNVTINTNARLSLTDASALANHELGVHLVTSLNCRKQPLKILSVGCPMNTTTQEGLAILSEYLSGNLTIQRLRTLALRVLAVRSLIEEKSFRKTFLLLKESYQTSEEVAFTITARVYRGGGFTKDYLYLNGLRLMLNAFEREPNFIHLLAGKTSLPYLATISRLIDKQYLIAPEYITPAFTSPAEIDKVSNFITHAIR